MTGANLRSTRQRLPNRRGSQAFVLEAGGLSFSAVASGFDDESLGKVFSQKRTAGSTVGFMVSEAASASSLTLQFGCPSKSSAPRFAVTLAVLLPGRSTPRSTCLRERSHRCHVAPLG